MVRIGQIGWCALTCWFVLSVVGCGNNLPTEVTSLQSELSEARTQVDSLQAKITELNQRNQSLIERLASVNASIKGGLPLSEREKQLDEREARLQQKEENLREREVRIKEDERVIDQKNENLSRSQREFVDSREEKLVQIGKAEQMERRYNEVLDEKSTATRRANNLVIYTITLFVALVVFCVIAFVYVAKYRARGRQITSAMETIKYADLSSRDKDHIAVSLGRASPQTERMIEPEDHNE